MGIQYTQLSLLLISWSLLFGPACCQIFFVHLKIKYNPAVVGWECESVSHSVVSDSLQPHGLYSPWNSPGQNTGVGSLSLLRRIFPTQGLNPGLPHCRQILYPLLGSVLIHGRLICLIVLFKSCISLLIFGLAVPHVIESGVLKSSTTLVFLFFFSIWVACSWVFPLVLWKA